MPFRFVHTADIHLDSPLRSLSLRNPDLAALIGDATRQALVAIVDLCLEERVDALIVAGDLYDGDQTSMKTARFLAGEMARLHAAGIAVFKVRGNHDSLSKITRELQLPPSVRVFGGRAEAVVRDAGGRDIVIHGMSFAKPQAPDSLLPGYRPPVPDAVNIGIMHTSLGGALGHDVYAPVSLADLQKHGFRYWALGHIHQRAEHRGATTVVMPGIPQGRDINEAGAKTVSLVTVGDDGTIAVEERRTSIAEFGRVEVDLSGSATWREAVDAVGRALAKARTGAASPHLVARLTLTGATPLSWQLHRDLDLMLAEAERQAEGIGKVWIEKIGIATREAEDRLRGSGADPVTEFGALMRAEIAGSPGLREEVRQLVKELGEDLPGEIRNFSGGDEAGFEAFVDRLLEDGSRDVLARLIAGGMAEEA
ncbi:serine/threonine phosphatase [Aureimonas endophytica]|uniref:Serine/threonine phosphatase n=1 Tax=Aureimonas endophytica TaxID=2027858 RepID=A0A916ZE58_9HYPH|nr:DNA repair exonuclease [Aureimonas endophytica]GGD91710.1 serine/threonine phosphatase [Aureimonas endophytica]